MKALWTLTILLALNFSTKAVDNRPEIKSFEIVHQFALNKDIQGTYGKHSEAVVENKKNIKLSGIAPLGGLYIKGGKIHFIHPRKENKKTEIVIRSFPYVKSGRGRYQAKENLDRGEYWSIFSDSIAAALGKTSDKEKSQIKDHIVYGQLECKRNKIGFRCALPVEIH